MKAKKHRYPRGWMTDKVLGVLGQQSVDNPTWLSDATIAETLSRNSKWGVDITQVHSALSDLKKKGMVTRVRMHDGRMTWDIMRHCDPDNKVTIMQDYVPPLYLVCVDTETELETGTGNYCQLRWFAFKSDESPTSWLDLIDACRHELEAILSNPNGSFAGVPQQYRLSVFARWLYQHDYLQNSANDVSTKYLLWAAHRTVKVHEETSTDWFCKATIANAWADVIVEGLESGHYCEIKPHMKFTLSPPKPLHVEVPVDPRIVAREAANKRAYQDTKGDERWAYDRQPSPEQRAEAYRKQQERALQYLVESDREEDTDGEGQDDDSRREDGLY